MLRRPVPVCPGFNFGVPRVRIDHWRNTPQTAPNEKVCFHENLGLRYKTPGKSNVCDSESPVFEETMKERGSIDEHFPL